MKPVAFAVLATCGGLLMSGASVAKDKAALKLRSTRLCDLSGCYVAWRVVDSDKDGVSDADEVMAGTNPRDARSKPSLRVVAEVAGKQQLPSFEAGLGVFVVFPDDIQLKIKQQKENPLRL